MKKISLTARQVGQAIGNHHGIGGKEVFTLCHVPSHFFESLVGEKGGNSKVVV